MRKSKENAKQQRPDEWHKDFENRCRGATSADKWAVGQLYGHRQEIYLAVLAVEMLVYRLLSLDGKR
jgi:hypothetical protein